MKQELPTPPTDIDPMHDFMRKSANRLSNPEAHYYPVVGQISVPELATWSENILSSARDVAAQDPERAKFLTGTARDYSEVLVGADLAEAIRAQIVRQMSTREPKEDPAKKADLISAPAISRQLKWLLGEMHKIAATAPDGMRSRNALVHNIRVMDALAEDSQISEGKVRGADQSRTQSILAREILKKDQRGFFGRLFGLRRGMPASV